MGLSSLFGYRGAVTTGWNRGTAMNASFRVFADFNNADRLGRIRLNTAGASDDLARSRVELTDGMVLELYDDDEIVAMGTARYDETEGWVAEVDWAAIG
jgi:hypothetical protein